MSHLNLDQRLAIGIILRLGKPNSHNPFQSVQLKPSDFWHPVLAVYIPGFEPYRDEHQEQKSWRQQWWALIRSCCLQDDDFWWLHGRFQEEKHFRRIFYRTWVTQWFLRTAKARSLRGSVNTLWYGPQRSSKSYSLIELTHRLDPTFAPNIKDRISFQLRELKAKLDGAALSHFFVHDEIRKSAYGEGSKWTMDEISDFLETHAKTGISIGFATPVKKFKGMLAGINFTIEIIGYNPESRISMGILRSHRGVEIGFVFFWHPPQVLADAYETVKDVFLAGHPEQDYYTHYIEQMKQHPIWQSASTFSDFDTILWDQEPSMASGLRKKIARKAHLLFKMDQGIGPKQGPQNVIVVHEDFMTVLRQCAHQFVLRYVQKPDVAERWILRYFEGLTHPAIAERLHIKKQDTVGKSIKDLDKRLSKTEKGVILEQALGIYLNAYTAKQVGSDSSASSTDPILWRVGGGVGVPDVRVGPAGGGAPWICVNAKLLFQHRPSWTLKTTPESEVAPAGRAFLCLVMLSAATGAAGPFIYRVPHGAQHATTGKGAGSVEEVPWQDWLTELQTIIQTELEGGEAKG